MPQRKTALLAYSRGYSIENVYPHEIRLAGAGDTRKATLVHYPASFTQLELIPQRQQARRPAAAEQQEPKPPAFFNQIEASIKEHHFMGDLTLSGGSFFREYVFGKGRRTRKAQVEITASMKDGGLILTAQNAFPALTRKQAAVVRAEVYNALAAAAGAFLPKVRRFTASPSVRIDAASLIEKAPDQGASLSTVKARQIVAWSHATRSKPEEHLSYAEPKNGVFPEETKIHLLFSSGRVHACTVVTTPNKQALTVPQALSAALDLLQYESRYTKWLAPKPPTIGSLIVDYVKSAFR